MNFYDYMVQKYIREMSPFGDLARDMQSDKYNFPDNGTTNLTSSRRKIGNYLISRNACYDCIESFVTAWYEYEAFIKRTQRTAV